MKKLFAQVCIFLGLVLVVQLVRLPYGSYRTKVLPRIRELTQGRGVLSLDASAIDLRFPTKVELKDLSLVLAAGRVPLPLFVDSAWATLNVLPLFALQAKVDGEMQLYKGKVAVVTRRPIFGGNLEATVDITGLQLDAHPFLKGVGVRGTLDSLIDLKIPPPKAGKTMAESAAVTLTVKDGRFDGTSVPLPGIPVALPVIDNIGITGKLNLKQSRLDISKLVLTSNLINIDASGQCELSPTMQIQQGTVTANIELSEEGKVTFGTYLALAAQKPIDKPPASYQAEFEFTNGRVSKANVRAL